MVSIHPLDESLLQKSLPVLVKTFEDLKPAEAVIKQWLSEQTRPVRMT
jgi:hypothetical protein